MIVKLNKKDLIWSYIGTIMSMGANLLMLPFLLYYLNDDMLGLWYVFASIGAIATLFDFGFAVTFARNITYCWSGAKKLKKEDVAFTQNSEPDFVLMKSVLSTCKIIYGLLSVAALILLLSIGTAYISYVSREIEGPVPIIAWIIYAIAAFLNLYYGYFASFLRGVGAVDQVNKNTVCARGIQIVLTVFLLAMGTGIIGACVAYLIYGTVFRLLGKHHFYKYHRIGEKLAQVTEKVSKQDLKDLFHVVWHNAWRDGVISIANYFCNQASTVVCSMYLPLSQTGIYSLGIQIASAIAQIAGTMYNAYQPELQSAYVNGDSGKMRRMMSMIVMSFVYLFLLGTLTFTVVGLPLLRIIKSNTIIAPSVLLLVCLYQFMLKFRNCYTSYFSCTNRIIYVNGFIVSAVLNVGLSFLMIGPLQSGIWGLIAAQIISQAVYNIWRWPILAHQELKFSAGEMVKIGTEESWKLLKGFLPKKKQAG